MNCRRIQNYSLKVQGTTKTQRQQNKVKTMHGKDRKVKKTMKSRKH